MKILSTSEEMTFRQGRLLAGLLAPGDIVCLTGELGSGKTVLARGISSGLGIRECEVLSPTFVLMRCHRGRMPMYHFDLYRLSNPRDILGLGYEEFFFSDGVSVIEWADRLGKLEPGDCLKVRLQHKGDSWRQIVFTAKGGRHRKLLEKLRRTGTGGKK